MKFRKIFNKTVNKRTNQISFNIRVKELKKIGLTPSKILEMSIPKNNVQFYKGKKIK
jgi:hypothetical protein